jgi:hypothetical protein
MFLQRLKALLLGLLFIGLPTYKLLQGMLGARSRLETAMWLMPFTGLLLLINYRIHFHLLLLSMLIPVTLPRIMISRALSLFAIIPLILWAGAILRMFLQIPAPASTNRKLDLFMTLGTIITVMWLAISPPGSGSFGTERGGAWEAVFAVAGLAAYWGLRSLRGLAFNWKRLSLLSVTGAIAGIGYMTVVQIMNRASLGLVVASWFFQSGWWLYGILLGIIIKIRQRKDRMFTSIPLYVLSALLLSNALTSGFRSRIIFGPFMVGVAFWAGGMRKRMFFTALFFLIVCAFIANSQYYNDLPRTIRRVVSVVRAEEDQKDIGVGEMGRKSPWRAQLWRSAQTKIKEKPVTGHGYAFNTDAFFADLSSARYSDLALRGVQGAGQFHNLPLNLMYFWGIPAAIIFCIGWLMVLTHLLKWAGQAEGWYGAFVVAIIVYATASTGQALMNAGGQDFLAICTIMGIYQMLHGRNLKTGNHIPPAAAEGKPEAKKPAASQPMIGTP